MSPDPREVGAAVLLRIYWHLHAAELILDGMEPREANEACWKIYYTDGLFTYALIAARNDSRPVEELMARAEYPAGRPPLAEPLATTPSKGPHKHWTTRCLVAGLLEDEQLLATTWEDLTRRYGHTARARISAGHVAALGWECHMLWLLATGAGDLLHCARIAFDRAAGKPARKRRPADPAWLAAQLDGALGAAWDAFRMADDGAGKPFWTTPLGTVRPRADDAASAGTLNFMNVRVGSPKVTDALHLPRFTNAGFASAVSEFIARNLTEEVMPHGPND